VNATTTPSELTLTYKQQRAALLGAPLPHHRSGRRLVDDLTAMTVAFVQAIAAQQTWQPGWVLVATGGTGRAELCPGSDVDLLLLHPKKVPDKELAGFGESLWYPLWDAGLSVTPGVHTIESATELGEREVLSAASWLDTTVLAGDQRTAGLFVASAGAARRKHAKRQLRELIELTRQRHERSGDVAFLLGPDLRDGHGGLRDVLVLRYMAATEMDGMPQALEQDPTNLAVECDVILGTRAELHRCTRRPHDVLALQEQDAVASALGLVDADGVPDADAMLARVSSAARTIGWCYDQSARRVEALLDRKRALRFGRPLKLSADISLQSGEVVLAEGVDPATDPSLVLRVGAAAALNKLPISRNVLQLLAARAPQLGNPWPDRARHALVALLGAGPIAIEVIEALDHHDLMTRVLPEWSTVRAKPQRNAYHRFTVDRHLVEAAVNASSLVRSVARPDLLLIGTWLHDIGKGYPGDHTEVGVVLIRSIAERMGFVGQEVETLVAAVQHHLLLPETATRRDLSDPAVITNVARLVADVDTLQLLRALTEADSLATGPTAWSPWKGQLCDDLVHRVERVLAGHRPPEVSLPSGPDVDAALRSVRNGSDLSIQATVDPTTSDLTLLTVAALDRTGLISALTGALAVSGIEVLSADVWTTADGIALDVLRVTRRLGGETDWRRVERLIRGALDGSVNLRAELDKRAKSYASKQQLVTQRGAAPEVIVDDDIEERATVVEVRAPDQLALLYRVATTLTSLGLDIRAAKVTTLGHEVVDSFSVLRVLPDGTRVKEAAASGPSNAEVRAAVLDELTS
jgi:[protein-PII] uridylyltransferase